MQPLRLRFFIFSVIACRTRAVWNLPESCPGQMWAKDARWDFVGNYSEETGQLVPMSWHIHYTTNTSEFVRFYRAFVDRFQAYFPPGGDVMCPFGPNYISASYKYVCSFEEPLNETFVELAPEDDKWTWDSPWTTSQRAFFVPMDQIAEIWAWTETPEVRGSLDLLLHGNTGCYYDDHTARITWRTSRTAPVIRAEYFPCNVPGTGCNDTIYGDLHCGCNMPLVSDQVRDSCKYCAQEELPAQLPVLV